MTKRMKRAISFGSEHGAALPAKRGVALMLVVVALGTATVLTTAYLMSKDNSAAIGANAQDTAASSWVARSGAELALAVLQTQEDWVDADPEKLFEGFSIAGGTVSVALTNLQGEVPDGTETELAMTVVADVNGIKTVLQRIVSIQPDAVFDDAVDAELGEFGIFAATEIDLSDTARIGAWPMSPAYLSGEGVKIGAGFVDASSMGVNAGSAASRAELYVRPDAAAPLQAMTSDSTFVDGAVLQMVVPAIPPLKPADFGALPVIEESNLTINDSSLSTRLVSGTYANLKIDKLDTVVTLDDTDGGVYLFDDLDADHESVLLISGDVQVCVINNMKIQNCSAIEFADDTSRVRFYVGKQFKVHKTAVGLPREIARKPDRGLMDIDKYVDPSRLRVYALESAGGGDADPDIDIFNGSIANMVVHAPLSQIEVKGSSWVIGRLTGDIIKIKDDSGLLYDPVLDSKVGYTAFKGPLYQSNGDLQVGLKAAIDSYDVLLGLEQFQAHVIANVTTEVVPVQMVGIGDPTPRSHDRAIEKLWPFVAKAIENGSWVTGDHEVRQESLYVPLDPSIFDLDQFYNNGVISATHVGQQALEVTESQVAVPIGSPGNSNGNANANANIPIN